MVYIHKSVAEIYFGNIQYLIINTKVTAIYTDKNSFYDPLRSVFIICPISLSVEMNASIVIVSFAYISHKF